MTLERIAEHACEIYMVKKHGHMTPWKFMNEKNKDVWRAVARHVLSAAGPDVYDRIAREHE